MQRFERSKMSPSRSVVPLCFRALNSYVIFSEILMIYAGRSKAGKSLRGFDSR